MRNSSMFRNQISNEKEAKTFGLNSILFVNIYNTQHIHVLYIQVIYKRGPEESQIIYLNLYPIESL